MDTPGPLPGVAAKEAREAFQFSLVSGTASLTRPGRPTEGKVEFNLMGSTVRPAGGVKPSPPRLVPCIGLGSVGLGSVALGGVALGSVALGGVVWFAVGSILGTSGGVTVTTGWVSGAATLGGASVWIGSDACRACVSSFWRNRPSKASKRLTRSGLGW